MKYTKIIKQKLNRLRSTKCRLVDIFCIMHDTDGMFCEQVKQRFYVQQLSYTEIKRRALNAAGLLAEEHNNKNIGIKMHNSYEFTVMLWAVVLSGNTPVLINTEFDDNTTNDIINDLSIAQIFDDKSASGLIKQVENKLEPQNFDFEKALDQIILTTTGATGRCKYCFYNGAGIAAFLFKTPYIVKRLPQIAKPKQIKHLAFLPFYHVFGLFAVYFWFGFFGLPFLFIDNIFTDLMQNIRSYKVTHIFAVPLLFKTIQKEILKKAKQTGRLEILNQGIQKSFLLQSKLPISRKTLRKKFGEVTNNTLGKNISFMICGGAAIDPETLQMFNCIGYDLHVGYGMTEVGITSLNLNPDIKSRCEVSIGEPLPGVTYKLGSDNVLNIMCDTSAFKVVNGSSVINLDKDTFYHTNDKCVKDGRIYKFEARDDEIIAAENGENYNLNALQSCNYGVDFADSYCFMPYKNSVALLISVYEVPLEDISELIARVRTNQILKTKKVSRILITEQSLPKGLKLINHREVAGMVLGGKISVCDMDTYTPKSLSTSLDTMTDRLTDIIAKALDISKDKIPEDADLFLELGCTSFDYYVIMQDILAEFGVGADKFNKDSITVLQAGDVPRTLTEIKKFILENKTK